MKTKSLTTVLALTLTTAALAQTPAATLPATWNADTLSKATYVILEPRLEGNADLLSKDQQAGVVAALKRDSAGAIKRHYAGAQFTEDANLPGAIQVTPVLVAPDALVPWAKLSARLELQLPGDHRVTLGDTFSLLTLWQKSWDAANYALDQLVSKMP